MACLSFWSFLTISLSKGSASNALPGVLRSWSGRTAAAHDDNVLLWMTGLQNIVRRQQLILATRSMHLPDVTGSCLSHLTTFGSDLQPSVVNSRLRVFDTARQFVHQQRLFIASYFKFSLKDGDCFWQCFKDGRSRFLVGHSPCSASAFSWL